MRLANEIYEELLKMPLYDVHTHVDASHLSARGLDDIILYHMIVSELYAAGCPDGARVPEDRTDEEAIWRLERAAPYFKYVQNSSLMWVARTILKDLYGWDQPVTEENWREIHEIIREKNAQTGDLKRAHEICDQANIERLVTELWRGREHQADDLLQYSIEWAFFTRMQWGRNDAALYELENAWSQETPGAPLAVTATEEDLAKLPRIKNMEDLDVAMKHYVDAMPYDQLLYAATHYSSGYNYRKISREEMERALANRENATVEDGEIYANYLYRKYLDTMLASGNNIIQVFSIGAEPLPFEMSSSLRSETFGQLATMFADYPDVRFSASLSSAHAGQELNTMIRELPNLSAGACWWHNFFPSFMQRMISERLDMLPMNKHCLFFSDAYCIDWAYGKAFLTRMQIAEVLAKKIEEGQYTKELALAVAREILTVTPETLMGMKPRP